MTEQTPPSDSTSDSASDSTSGSFWGTPAPPPLDPRDRHRSQDLAAQTQAVAPAATAAASSSSSSSSNSFWGGVQPPPPQPTYQLPPPPGADSPLPPPPVLLQPARSYATWLHRVFAALADGLLLLPFFFLGYFLALLVSRSNPFAALDVLFLTLLAAFIFDFWNLVVRQGTTGSSIGKEWLGIRVIRLDNGLEPGIGLSFARAVLHLLDVPFLLGFLWPLWDEQNQTFADKIVGTVVVMRRY